MPCPLRRIFAALSLMVTESCQNMTVRHLTGSAEVITILNHGHGVCFTKVFMT